MKERGIVETGPMVRAILDGRKTQTRRIVKWPATGEPIVHYLALDGTRASQDAPGAAPWPFVARDGSDRSLRCPYGEPGDRLWVRETFARNVPGCEEQGGISYRADHNDPLGDGPAHPMRWTPAIHMTRAASRIDLEVTAVRVERLCDITEDDARAEGVTLAPVRCSLCRYAKCGPDGTICPVCDCDACEGRQQIIPTSHIAAFAALWDSLNNKRDPWASNPWVWVVGFRVLRPTGGSR